MNRKVLQSTGLLFIMIICLLRCTPVKKMTPTQEIKQEAVNASKTDTLLANILAQHPQYFDSLLKNNAQWQIRIIYTQIDRTSANVPQLKHYYYNIDPTQYFYPASTVKLPAAALALQKINELRSTGVDKHSTMITEAGAPGQSAVYNDPTTADGRPTIAHYIKKIFLVSDNDAYNRLYEFLGQEYLNASLHKMGYDSVQLLHRLQISLTPEQNRTTNPVKFYNNSSQLLYSQPLVTSNYGFAPRSTFMGQGFMQGGKLVAAPFDFSKKNRITLPDLHSILQSIIFPASVPSVQRFNLTADDYRFLYRYMSMMPSESSYPKYDSSYTDAYAKFLMFGGKGIIENKGLRIFNKVGDAYGFLQDVAYIIDAENGLEFMLTASIYCNSDGIFNDDHYDYEKVGLPFLKNLGQVIYAYELQRPKKVKPDLSQFKIDYTEAK